MSFDVKKLYEMLPAIYRIRDAEQGEPLKDLLSVIAGQAVVLEEDLAQLYDDQFIETCAPWVIPYIGDLVGYRPLHGKVPNISSPREEVANTIAYRRRKGTAAMLLQLARDVTSWNACVVEFFQLIATTQHMNHIRNNNLQTPDLREWEHLEYRSTPFDSLAHNVDVRRIAVERGRYNIPSIGIFLWRLNAYGLEDSIAFKVDDRRYLFSPLGIHMHLFTKPQTEDEITRPAEPINVPMPIGRRVLKEHLSDYYGENKSIFIKKDDERILVGQIVVCDLSDKDNGEWAHEPPEEDKNTGEMAKIAIDPVLGRIAFPNSLKPKNDVKVTYHYGFSAEMGGGSYNRKASFNVERAGQLIYVPENKQTIQSALDGLKENGVIEITDNGHYEDTLKIHLSVGNHIEIRAADKKRPNLKMRGEFLISGDDDTELTINGLLISGILHLLEDKDYPNKLRHIRIKHCTLVPGAQSLIVESPETSVEIDRCIIGGLRVADGADVHITNSIVDASSESSVAYAAPDGINPGGTLHVENSTIIGKVNTSLLKLASNTIFLAGGSEPPVRAQRLQEGCVRFSYVPLNSKVPRRYNCKPVNESDALRLRPQFTSLNYGHPGYCQLGRNCAVEIREGADDGAEMGAFHDLYQPQREANLRIRLNEYLRFGLEAGIFYVS